MTSRKWDDLLAEVMKRLAQRLGISAPYPHELETVVVHAAARFRGARVEQYLPILIEREALRDLRVPKADTSRPGGSPAASAESWLASSSRS